MGEHLDVDERLNARYGRKPQNPGRSWWIAAASVACLAAVAAWYAFAGPGATPADTGSVRAEVSASHAPDAHHMEITFTINAPAERAVACAIDAKTEDFSIVGWKVIEIAPSLTQSRTFTHTLRTTQQSEAGFVDSCWLT